MAADVRQNDSLDLFQRDIMRGTHLAAVAPIGVAAECTQRLTAFIFFAATKCHALAALPAEHDAAKDVILAALFARLLDLDAFLHRPESLGIHQRFVRSLHNDPIRFGLPNHLFRFKILCAGAEMHHIPDVDLIHQNGTNRAVIPRIRIGQNNI